MSKENALSNWRPGGRATTKRAQHREGNRNEHKIRNYDKCGEEKAPLPERLPVKHGVKNEWEEASDPKSWTNLLMPRATSANKETGIPEEAG
jgi:hypothetical protein